MFSDESDQQFFVPTEADYIDVSYLTKANKGKIYIQSSIII